MTLTIKNLEDFKLVNKYITEVVIKDGITDIPSSSFYECTSLRSVTLPESLVTILKGAFYECTSLRSIKLPESLRYIERLAFSYCSSLRSINLPDSLEYIGEYAFKGCTSLKCIEVSSNFNVNLIPEYYRDLIFIVDNNNSDSMKSMDLFGSNSETLKSDTKIISGFPCIGKTTLYNSNRDKFMDLEFRETATSKGMDDRTLYKLYDSYVNIIECVLQANHYEYVFITDNLMLLKKLINKGISFEYIVPDLSDNDFITEHYNRVLNRNNQEWYNRIIVPRLDCLQDSINYLTDNGIEVKLLDKNNPYISSFIK